jgi:hypothetical protein
MDSSMNEEANFCSQCGAKISSGVKFCSNCGHDLQNSSTKTSLDANIKLEAANVKLETTNATLEKGFKSVEKGIKETGGKLGSLLKKIIKLIVKILILGAILYGVAFIGFMLQESYLKNDRDKALQDLKLKIETAQAEPFVESEWKVLTSADPASGKKLVTGVSTFSKGNLCSMTVERRIDRDRLTSFNCSFEFHRIPIFSQPISIKFDNNPNIYEMKKRSFSGDDSYFTQSSFYVMPDEGGGNAFSYYRFINSLTSAKMVAIKIVPTVDHEYYEFYNYATGTPNNSIRSTLGSVWIRFPLKGAREAIDKLGNE